MGFKVIRQRDTMQCGVAALAMICRHFGVDYSLNWLERYCHASSEGVSMKGIVDAARQLGMLAVASRIDVSMLPSLPLPCILHWNSNHFVVLYKVRSDSSTFYIADPERGKLKLKRSEFLSHWASNTGEKPTEGIALFLEKTEAFGNIREPKQKNRGSLKILLHYLKEHKKIFSHLALGLLFGCILQLAIPFLTQAIVDVGIQRESIGFIWLVLLGEFIIIASRTATDLIRRRLLLHVSMKVNLTMVSDFFIKLLKLPMSFFEVKLMGDLIQRIGDHSKVQNFLTGETLNILFSIMSFFVFGIALAIFSPVIALIYILFTLIYGGWLTMFLRKRRELNYDLFDLQSRNQNKTYELVTSMQEIKLQGCQKRRRWEWEDLQSELYLLQMRELKLNQTQMSGSIFINEMKNALVTILAASAVIDSGMTLGAMLAIQYIVGQLNSPVSQLLGYIYSIQDVRISLDRINEIHDSEEENTEESGVTEFSNGKDIEIRNLSFKYDPHALVNTLSDISLTIPEGSTTAIVGHSGSGKSTLLKLILGYYQPTEGMITVGGDNLKEFNMDWWRSNCGVVMQDGIIFSETIAGNIASRDGEINLQEVKEAARKACIHSFIKSLPKKYDTVIGRDGVGLSQGQKQRILIARSIYSNASFVILDEATNSLDTVNESHIVENLSELFEGKTVIIVAHRLSTIRNADNIAVMSEGRICETGTHSELIERRGEYYNLVQKQLEYV